MKNKFLETGKIVGTHGVRGMVRIQAWCDTPEFFCSLKKVYLDKEGKEALSIVKSAPHGNVVIAQIKGVDTIEAAEKFFIWIEMTPNLKRADTLFAILSAVKFLTVKLPKSSVFYPMFPKQALTMFGISKMPIRNTLFPALMRLLYL